MENFLSQQQFAGTSPQNRKMSPRDSPGRPKPRESANSAGVTQDETPSVEGEPGPSETDPIFVPEGVSVLDPALWEDGPATESAEYHDPERTAEDMRRIFGVDGGGISGQNKGADPWHGWLGPSPPQGVTLDSPSIRDEITRLTTQWHRYLTALQVYNEIEDKSERQHAVTPPAAIVQTRTHTRERPLHDAAFEGHSDGGHRAPRGD